MKLTIKTLQQTIIHVEAEPGDLVEAVKARIEAAHGHSVASQKLIFAGKIMVDSATVGSYNIKETDFLVLMVTKATAPKPTTASSSTPAATPAATAPSTTAAPTTAASTVTPAPTTVTPASTVTAPTSATFGESSLVTGTARETAIANLIEMGFERSQVERALTASFNNPDRAVEYLMTGNIPAPPATAVAPSGGNTAAVTTPTSGGPSPLQALAETSQFDQLRQLVRAQPELLQPLLQQLGAANPSLLQAINQNPEEFIRLLNEGGAGDDDEDEEGDETEGGGAAAGQQVIQVTPEEQSAIERLVALGFQRARAIEAFFACDKNETMAANFLFDTMNDD